MAPNRSLPCALCARSLEQREDKNGKPYFVCDECGTQFFIRGVAGKERLAELLRSAKVKGVGSDTKTLIAQLEQLQSYIEEFTEGEKVITGDESDSEVVSAFTDWSRGVLERVAERLKIRAGQR